MNKQKNLTLAELEEQIKKFQEEHPETLNPWYARNISTRKDDKKQVEVKKQVESHVEPHVETHADTVKKQPIEEDKKKSTSIGSRIIHYITMVVVFCFWLFILSLWIRGCTGNFLNVDEEPYPGLHWKP